MARRHSSREMVSLVAHYEKSGLTRREVAAEAGIAVHTLDCWRREAARRPLEEFVEIEAPLAAGSAPPDLWDSSPARFASKASEMYSSKIRPSTTCFYSAASMILRKAAAAAQS